MPSPLLSLSLLPLSVCLLVSARLHHSLVPEDPYAFPKYRVTFLNGLPVQNETAQRWLQEGLRGGEPEFLEQTWKEPYADSPQFKSIEGSADQETLAASDPASSQDFNYTLEHMRLGSKTSYLCLIPPPPEDSPATDDPQSDVTTPVHSWSLLQPLAGTCLYHRQGWFTYSYCHNSHVRQFHELPPQHPHRAGEYRPEEDAEWEAYTLGRAPPTLEAGADLTLAEEAAAANLELARGAGSRYLVQRALSQGHPRQFHCSMTMTDTVLFVKETQTCHYVLHIATPRLCGEPGFRSRIDAREEAYIRCREIVGAEEYERADRTLPPATHPFKRPRQQKSVIAPPPSEEPGTDVKQPAADVHDDLIRRAIERLLARGDLNAGELMIQFVDVDIPMEGNEDGEHFTLDGEALAEVLRAAGHDVRGEKGKKKKKSDQGEDEAEEVKTQRRDEL
ncbi:Protein OS-9 [Grifola frondosa]|uniref:Protein OS-9 homolog n=1 Tax=Grifola frondosa TaxID=5627 RepID=A0A1C7MGP9_GRIFR|nr:Protein OS-9 [Grifola frondosa]